MSSLTAIVIKPAGFERGLVGTILARFENRGFRPLRMTTSLMDPADVDVMYQQYVNEEWFDTFRRYMVSAPVVAVAMALCHNNDNAPEIGRLLIGNDHTPGTIRGDYDESFRFGVIHGCSTKAEIDVVLSLFFGIDAPDEAPTNEEDQIDRHEEEAVVDRDGESATQLHEQAAVLQQTFGQS